MKNLVKGGADFLGSHLIDVLKTSGEEVICMDNCSTGTKGNIKHWLTNKRFLFLDNDVISPVELKVDRIWHLSCPASPKHYQKDPIETTRTIFLGTYNMLELVSKSSAKLLFASTSEVYGKPEVHPQKENYYGSVNPLVIRSCYNEAKRLAESLCMNYVRMRAAKVKVACIFNTYGSWMQIDDGRVISNFIYQALGKKRLTNYGDGSQSRSFCYVKDLINGLISLMDSNLVSPVNLEGQSEYQIIKLAKIVNAKINSDFKVIKSPLPEDDTISRQPDLSITKAKLGWHQETTLSKGIDQTIKLFREIIN